MLICEKFNKMKKIFILMTCVFVYSQVSAQLMQSKPGRQSKRSNASSVVFGFSLAYGNPVGNFKNGYKSAWGIESQIGIPVDKTGSFFLTGMSGIYVHSAQDNNSYGNITNIPIKIGGRYYFTKKVFVNADFGIGFLKDKVSSFTSRFNRDFGAGYSFGKTEIAVFYDGWKKKSSSGYSDILGVKLTLGGLVK